MDNNIQKMVGRTLIRIRAAAPLELRREGLPNDAYMLILEFSGGFLVYALADEEGNDAGFLCVRDTKRYKSFFLHEEKAKAERGDG